VKYIFTDDKIIIKYPFKKENIYPIEEIIGLELYGKKTENWFIVYFADKKIKLDTDVRKFREKAKIFYEKYYKTICERNIETIKTKGFEVIIAKKRLIFFNNRIEITGKIEKMYFYNKDIVNIQYYEMVEQFKRIDIQTKDKYKIKLLSYKCKGGNGLFEYLRTIIKCSNVA
jgi:hypothetical protein